MTAPAYGSLRAEPLGGLSPKDPADPMTYALDWSDWLGERTISSSSWEAPDGITISSDDASTTGTEVTVTGGTAGRDYVLRNTITPSAGNAATRSILIQCRRR